MKTVSEIVDAFGGASAAATALDLPLTTVDSWKRRGSIPAYYWDSLVEAARKRGIPGVTKQRLGEIASAKPRRRASRARAA